MEKYDIGIIGGSASGLTAAVNAKRRYPESSIVIFEQLPRLGKKILATGNGRCNLTNLNALSHPYRNAEFAESVLNRYNPKLVIDFFNSLGLLTYADFAGRVYPKSNNASSVSDALRFEVLSCGVDTLTELKIQNIAVKADSFVLNGKYEVKKLIIATGGKSSPSQGSDGSGFALAESLGHTVTKLVPSLVPLNSRPEKVKAVKGIRVADTALTLEGDYKEYHSAGEILFTDNGISGIAAMELSACAERELRRGFDPVLSIDFLPEMSLDEVSEYITRVSEIKLGQPAENLLTGVLPKQLGVLLMKSCEIYDPSAGISLMSDNMTQMLATQIKGFKLPITGTKGFMYSQVTSGGIDVSEINSDTLQSKIKNGLYFCGEIIDVDGGCGGFNLQWAFASGLTAGELND